MRYPPVDDIRELCRNAKLLGNARKKGADLANLFKNGGSPKRSPKKVSGSKPSPQSRQSPRATSTSSPAVRTQQTQRRPVNPKPKPKPKPKPSPNPSTKSATNKVCEKKQSLSVSRPHTNFVIFVFRLQSSSSSVTQKLRRAWTNYRLRHFYAQHKPDQLAKVDLILTKYAGKYTTLFASLYRKYEAERSAVEVPSHRDAETQAHCLRCNA